MNTLPARQKSDVAPPASKYASLGNGFSATGTSLSGIWGSDALGSGMKGLSHDPPDCLEHLLGANNGRGFNASAPLSESENLARRHSQWTDTVSNPYPSLTRRASTAAVPRQDMSKPYPSNPRPQIQHRSRMSASSGMNDTFDDAYSPNYRAVAGNGNAHINLFRGQQSSLGAEPPHLATSVVSSPHDAYNPWSSQSEGVSPSGERDGWKKCTSTIQPQYARGDVASTRANYFQQRLPRTQVTDACRTNRDVARSLSRSSNKATYPAVHRRDSLAAAAAHHQHDSLPEDFGHLRLGSCSSAKHEGALGCCDTMEEHSGLSMPYTASADPSREFVPDWNLSLTNSGSQNTADRIPTRIPAHSFVDHHDMYQEMMSTWQPRHPTSDFSHRTQSIESLPHTQSSEAGWETSNLAVKAMPQSYDRSLSCARYEQKLLSYQAAVQQQYYAGYPYGRYATDGTNARFSQDMSLTGPYGNLPHAQTPPWASMWHPHAVAPRSDPHQGLLSEKLAEFHKTHVKGGRHWEMKDTYDHVVEFAGDQHGSRFLQDKLEKANSDERSRVFSELQPNSIQLMKDVFGNWVIQKFFERGDQNQKRVLASKMRGQVLDLSLHVYGCRVVQRALEHVLVDQQACMVNEFESRVLQCIRDQNGNHVIQKVIEIVPQEHMGFIVDAIVGRVQELAMHNYGCRVVQRALEHCEDASMSVLMRELYHCAMELISDQYGNYVVQNVIRKGKQADRDFLIGLVMTQVVNFSKQKFASNVVEKCIDFGSDMDRRRIWMTFSGIDAQGGESQLASLIKDGYGNYVIQRLLDALTIDDYKDFVAVLEPEILRSRRQGQNKQVENVARKMKRFEQACVSRQHIPGAQCQAGDDESAVVTPSLVTDGTQSPRSASNSLASSAGCVQGLRTQRGSFPTISVTENC